MALEEKTKLLALAHLKSGKSPRNVSDLLDLSYAQALKLNKELMQAEKQNKVLELFKLDNATLEALLEKVSEELSYPLQELEGELVDLNDNLADIAKELNNLGILEKELQDAAITIAKRLTTQALLATSNDNLLTLTEALAKLQTAFFAKGTNVQVNNINGNFEKYLRD